MMLYVWMMRIYEIDCNTCSRPNWYLSAVIIERALQHATSRRLH